MILGELNPRQVDRIVAMLDGMPNKIRNKILRRELRNAAKQLAAKSRVATPVTSGTLRRTVKVRAGKRSRRAVTMTAGYNKGTNAIPKFYAAFLEWGYRWGKRKSAKAVLGESKRRRRLTAEQRAKVQSVNDARRKIPGKYTLTRVAERVGPALIDIAIRNIGQSIEAEARNA